LNLADKILRLKKHKLGKVFVKYSEAIDLTKFVEQFNIANPPKERRSVPTQSLPM